MKDLRSEAEVKTALRRIFAFAAGIDDPTDIVDTSNLYDPSPPKGDLGFAPPLVAMLIPLAARELLGTKVVAVLGTSLLPPDLSTLSQFGPLALTLSDRFNRLGRRAIFLAVCKALERDPDSVTPSTTVAHPDEPGGLAFAARLEHELKRSVCGNPTFAFTESNRLAVIAAGNVGGLVDSVIDVIKKGCL